MENLYITVNHGITIPKQNKIDCTKYILPITNGIYFTIILINLVNVLDISTIIKFCWTYITSSKMWSVTPSSLINKQSCFFIWIFWYLLYLQFF